MFIGGIQQRVSFWKRGVGVWFARPLKTLPSGQVFSVSRRSFAIGAMARHVAVIGAGAGGLAAGRELLLEGHAVTVFEIGSTVGGTWNYTESRETDLLGRHGIGKGRIHSSMYEGLRTNLPREIMGYSTFPFLPGFPGSHDDRQFPPHTEVEAYLKAYAVHAGLLEHIRFGVQVLSVEDKDDDASWSVTYLDAQNSGATTETFDAVVVCNGHYSEPYVPDIPGLSSFPGHVMHSHNYRRPEEYKDQRVVLLGAASSGIDISYELQGIASKVYLSARSFLDPLTGKPVYGDGLLDKSGNEIVHCPGIESLSSDGSIKLADGTVLQSIDTIMFCTGYNFSFPFLSEKYISTDGGTRVRPLYQHTFPPKYAPGLSFLGLCIKIVPFPQMEAQAQWVARCLSGNAQPLPSVAEMEQKVSDFYKKLEESGTEHRHTHRCTGDQQWELNEFYRTAAQGPVLGKWRKDLYSVTGEHRRKYSDSYRDRPLEDGEDWQAKALEEKENVVEWERNGRPVVVSKDEVDSL